jgi:hypothetical protein
MTKNYKVTPGQTLWSNKHQKHFNEGEIIDLSHAFPADIAILLGIGAIVEEEVKEIKPFPVKKEKVEEQRNG